MGTKDGSEDPLGGISEKDTEVMEAVLEKPKLSKSDASLLSNFSVQFIVSLILFITFLIFRMKAKWLYSPNTRNRPNHPCFGYTGFLNWIVPVISVGDTKLLSIIGLDAFMMLQALKLLYRALLIFSITVTPVLSYIYYTAPNARYDQIFSKLSIGNIDKNANTVWLLPLSVYFISIIVMYLIFIYYKRYIVLRQVYLRNPAILTSITTLKKISKDLESSEKAVEYINMPNRTVIVSRLPKFLHTDEDLYKFIDSLGVGEIEDCVMVHDTSALQKLYAKRDETINNLEEEIDSTVCSMERYSRLNRPLCKQNISSFGNSFFETVDKQTIYKFYADIEKQKLIQMFIKGGNKFKRKYDNVSAINYYIDKLQVSQQSIDIEKERIKGIKSNTSIIELEEENNSLFVRDDISTDASFFSFKTFLNIRKNSKYFTLDLPFSTKRGFVTFKDQRSAGIIIQSKIGSRIFSVTAEKAPAPNDVIWSNVTTGEVANYCYRLFGDLFFVTFNILFYFLVVLVVSMLELRKFNPNNSIVIFLESREVFKSLYNGIIPPLVYNGLLVTVPIIITALVNLQGIYSYSKFQLTLMRKYCYFLFINGFVAMFFTSTFFMVISDLFSSKKEINEVIIELGDNILDSSVFFANIIIQRTFFGSCIFILKIAPLVTNILIFSLKGRQTRRKLSEAEYSPPFDFGSNFPALLVVFPMSIVYAVTTPPILIFGFIFYFLNYYIMKIEFLYVSRNEYESGGSYWDISCQIVILSLLTFQIATGVIMFTLKKYTLIAAIAPVILLTYLFKTSINKMFYRSCNCYPLNVKEEEYLDEFTKQALDQRVDLLENWDETPENEDVDYVPIEMLGYKDSADATKVRYYKDPSTGQSASKIILPKSFFRMFEFLALGDNDNVFGFNLNGNKTPGLKAEEPDED